jgi:hypothetical protein
MSARSVLCSTRHKPPIAFSPRTITLRAMNHKPALYALERLHAELGGKILANRKETARLAQDMRHVEAVLKLLEPGFDVRRIAVRRRNQKNPWFKKGEMFRHAIDILRHADKPMTGREITEAMLRAQGFEPDRKAVRSLFGGVQASLRNHDGKTVERVGEGKPAHWVLKSDAGPA